MFKIFDLNMNEIPFPEGVKPLDIFVSSVNKRRLTEEFEGRSGALNYGYDYGERSVDLSLWLEAHDTIDYRLIRNELYAFFDTHDVFYIEETRVPSRVLKVTIDESYIPERINQTHSSVEISCRTLDSVFWESKYTTLELHDSGYSATAEKYGLVDNIDDEKVKYRFRPDVEVRDLSAMTYKYGLISGTGTISSNEDYIYNEDFIELLTGQEYTFYDEGSNSNLRYWWFVWYDDDENFIERVNSLLNPDPKVHTFVAKGSKLRVMSNSHSPISENPIYIEDFGVDIIPTISGSASFSEFSVYNAGNVTVEPESMYLNIFATYVKSAGDFTIRNNTTGDEFILRRESNGSHVRLNGMVVSMGSLTNIFRDTNKRFISLAPGDNQFEVLNGAFDRLDIDFNYYYK